MLHSYYVHRYSGHFRQYCINKEAGFGPKSDLACSETFGISGVNNGCHWICLEIGAGLALAHKCSPTEAIAWCATRRRWLITVVFHLVLEQLLPAQEWSITSMYDVNTKSPIERSNGCPCRIGPGPGVVPGRAIDKLVIARQESSVRRSESWRGIKPSWLFIQFIIHTNH